MATKQAEQYKQKGNDAFKKGDHGLAIEMYTYATELDPNNPIFFTNRSNAYFMMKKYDKSERDARKAVGNNSKWEKGHYRLGMALMAQDKCKEALEAFKTACDLKPDNAAFEKARTDCRAKMMKDMSSAEILKQDGNECFKKGQIEQAVEIYGKAISSCKDTDKDKNIKKDCLANRAACYRQLYRPEECIADCTQALEIDPKHVKALIRRAQAYESMEKYKKALDDFVAAAQADPSAHIALSGANRLRAAMKKLGMM